MKGSVDDRGDTALMLKFIVTFFIDFTAVHFISCALRPWFSTRGFLGIFQFILSNMNWEIVVNLVVNNITAFWHFFIFSAIISNLVTFFAFSSLLCYFFCSLAALFTNKWLGQKHEILCKKLKICSKYMFADPEAKAVCPTFLLLTSRTLVTMVTKLFENRLNDKCLMLCPIYPLTPLLLMLLW